VMKLYIIKHKQSGKVCSSPTPYGEHCFSGTAPPNLYKTLGQAKSAISRGINNAKSGEKTFPDSGYGDWLQFLSDIEVMELSLDFSSGTVIYRANQQLEKK